MKKIIIPVLVIFTILSFIGCKSEPIEPQIIGITHLKTEKGIIIAEIDSIYYVPTEIYTGEKTQKYGMATKIKPIDGMLVTCFTSKAIPGTTFFAGKVTTEEIEEIYYSNSTPFIFIFSIALLAICTITLIIDDRIFKTQKSKQLTAKNKTKTSSKTKL